MANEEQLSMLKQGVKAWNEWRAEHRDAVIDLREADLNDLIRPTKLTEDYRDETAGWRLFLWLKFYGPDDLDFAEFKLNDPILDHNRTDLTGPNFHLANLGGAKLRGLNLIEANLSEANLYGADLSGARLNGADLSVALLRNADLSEAHLNGADLTDANLIGVNLSRADLNDTNLSRADLGTANLNGARLRRSRFSGSVASDTNFGNLDLSEVIGLEDVRHTGPSRVSTDTLVLSKGKIPEVFLRGCGLSDWEIEAGNLYNPELSNEEVNKILYRVYDLRATQALQISHLFVSYSRADNAFVEKLETHLNGKGIRYWRDIHDMKSGRMEKQIDLAIRQNPTVLLILSEHSLSSDWVEHEVRTARSLEKELGRDTLCPVALDDSGKNSSWPKRVMEQIMEYNILDFSDWRDDSKFDGTFRKLIDGLELFYKG